MYARDSKQIDTLFLLLDLMHLQGIPKTAMATLEPYEWLIRKCGANADN